MSFSLNFFTTLHIGLQNVIYFRDCRCSRQRDALRSVMRFLVQFRGLHNDLRLSEFLSIVSLIRNLPESSLSELNLTPAISQITGVVAEPNPFRGDAGVVLYGEIFFYVELSGEEEAKAIASRCVLLRAIYAPVAHGIDYPACIQSIDTPPFASALVPLRCPHTRPTFRCYVDAFGKSYSIEEQLHRIHKFSDMLRSFPGKVRMSKVDHALWILEDAFPRNGHGKGATAPRQIFVGRKIAGGQGHVGATYSLKRRRYIGPTSMDAELSFVMANMARVREGDLVMDPFCGTGSVLVACGALGAHVMGGDINLLALRGKGQATVGANMKQYGLDKDITLIRADVLNSPIRKIRGGWFDAVVCDPPYGIKEGMRVFREDSVDAGLERNHFQGTQRVRFSDFLRGVLSYGASVLVTGGRLVYWLPTTTEYSEEDVPQHPGLEIVHNCEQPLTSRMSRRLITMVRVPDKVWERREREMMEGTMNGKGKWSEHRPAHFDLARKLLRQPERAEGKLRLRDGMI